MAAVSPGARHVMEPDTRAGGQMQCVAWTQVSLRSTTANRMSDLPRYWSFAARNPAKTTNRSYRDFCNRRFFIFVHSPCEGSYAISHAFGGIFCADQTGFAYAELQEQNARSSRFLAAYPRCGACAQSSLRVASLDASVPAGPGAYRPIRLGQERRPLLRANRQYPRFRTGSLEIASGCGRRLVRGQRISLALSLVCAPSPCACVAIFTAERQANNPLNIERNIRNHRTLACVSLRTMRTRCSLAACRFRNQQQSCNVGASQTLGSGRSGAEPARTEPAHSALWAPSMAERDIILEALAEFPDPSEATPARWPGLAAPEHQLSPTQLVVRRSEMVLPPPP